MLKWEDEVWGGLRSIFVPVGMRDLILMAKICSLGFLLVVLSFKVVGFNLDLSGGGGMEVGVWGWIFWVIWVPMFEELLFRGWVYGWICKEYGDWVAMMGSGLLFGLLHWDWERFFSMAILGFFLGYGYYRSRKIWVSIWIHGLWNGLILLRVSF